MGRWSRLSWCLGLVAAAGCTIPGMDNSLIQKQGLSESLPQISVQSRKSGEAGPHTKDPDLPPEKAAKLCMATAEELEKNGHVEQAITQYELAIKHYPKIPGAGKKLAACYAQAGKFDESIAQYQKNLAASPKDPDILNDLGYTYFEKQEFATAEKYLRQAIAIKPGHQRAHGNLGLALGRQGKWKESLDSFRKAGTPATAQANLAEMYFAAGLYEDARRSCNIALGMDPNLKPAKELMAKIDELPKDEQKTAKQVESKLIREVERASQEAAQRNPEAQEAGEGVQLQKPVRVNRQEPREFKPVSR